MLLDRDELRRQDDAHVQGHRDGLANGLARNRAAPRSDLGLASLHLAPPPRMMPAYGGRRDDPPPAEESSGDTRVGESLVLSKPKRGRFDALECAA
jgi:hypothetical protein